jgi:hypothetical protein
MSKLAVSLCAILMITPVSAVAQQAAIDLASGQSQLRGTAGFACLISTPSSEGVSGAIVSSTNGTTQVVFQPNSVIDSTTLVARAFQVRLEVPVTCNGAHGVVVRSARGGMQLANPTVGGVGISNRIDLDVVANWTGLSSQLSTLGSPIGITLAKTGAASGSVEVIINTRAGTDPLVAGRYSDEIIVDLIALQ